MSRTLTLALTQSQHDDLMRALIEAPAGNEALAFLTCGHRIGPDHSRYAVHKVHVPSADSIVEATPHRLSWRTDCLAPVIDTAERFGHAIIKVHSHPGGTVDFSRLDDASDYALFAELADAVDGAPGHGSAILLPDGTLRARMFEKRKTAQMVDLATVVGEDIRLLSPHHPAVADFAASHATLFGRATYDLLRPLRVALIGVSGTGSPVAEQLVRLGVGTLILVDGDHAEHRNINRVYNMRRADADRKELKVDIAERDLSLAGTGTRIIRVPHLLSDPRAIEAVASADIIVGCVDTLQGRFLMSLTSAHYNQPYIDVGVKLDTHASGKIREVCGTVHYMRPGGGSLMSRGLFTPEDASAEEFARLDPDGAGQRADAGYINLAGRVENRPAVISLNTSLAAQAVTELLARIAPFREQLNSAYASVTVSFSSMEFITQPDTDPCKLLLPYVGRGDRNPLLGLATHTEARAA